MTIDFTKTEKLQENISNAIKALNNIRKWLEPETIYTRNDLGERVEAGKRLFFNWLTTQSLEDYLRGTLWRLNLPITFTCTDDELPQVIEQNCSHYSDSYRKILFDVAREHNPRVKDIEAEFLNNLSDYSPDSIRNLIGLYNAKWKGKIPVVDIEFGYFKNSHDDSTHPLHDVIEKAENSGLLDYVDMEGILSILDWMAFSLSSITEEIKNLFKKYQGTTLQGSTQAGTKEDEAEADNRRQRTTGYHGSRTGTLARKKP